MNYLRIYNDLIIRANNRDELKSYTEKHHIIPRCMGGADDMYNLAKLTPEEHYLAHQLLVKIYPNNHQLVYAATMMCACSKSHNNSRSNNKLYGWLKRKLSIAASIRSAGNNNTQYGTCWIHSIELKSSKKINKLELQKFLDTGWGIGRIINFDKTPKSDKRRIIRDTTDAKYLNALLQSDSISSALRLLGLKTSGAGYARMKEVIKKNNLQNKFSHEYIIWD